METLQWVVIAALGFVCFFLSIASEASRRRHDAQIERIRRLERLTKFVPNSPGPEVDL